MLPRRALLALPLVIAASLALGCTKKSDDEIVVGAYLSLSGPDSTFGIDSKDGIALAVDEVNAAGGVKGKKIRVVYEDDKSTTQEATQKVRQLIDRDKAVALLGEVASSRSLAGGLIANTSKVPMISPSSSAKDVTEGRDWVFRTCPTDEMQGVSAARFVKDELKKTKVGVFYTAQDTYSTGLAKAFRDAFTKIGGQIVVDKGYPKGETNFRTFLAELKAASPEVVFVPNYYGDMVPIARQAKELGMPGSIFIGGDGWDSADLLTGAGAELEGAYFMDHYAPDVPWPASKAFLSKFAAKYHHEPTTIGAQGYDGARILFDAIGRAASIQPDAIRKALLETKDFVGATGPTTIGADRNANKPIVAVLIKDRKFTFAKELPLP
jgi:branched-chain amino acid transport system substrate-binding protein